MKSLSRILIALVCLVGASQAHAQSQCPDTDTFASCADRLLGSSPASRAAEEGVGAARLGEAADVGRNARKLVALKNTGDPSAVSVNDFLPLLRALIDAGGFMGDSNGKIGLEWSNPLGLPAEHQNKLSVVLQRSELYEPLKDALRDADATRQIDMLEDRIDAGDDITLGFSYSLASQRYGRDPELHRDLFSAVLNAVDVRDQLASEAIAKREAFIRQHGLDDQVDGAFSAVPQALRAEYVRLTETMILAQRDSMRALGRRLQKTGFYGLADLINNQPQWSVTALYRSRDEAVGADEFRAVASYEFGWANVNAYRRYANAASCAVPQRVLCVADYLAQEDVIAGLKESRRVTFRAEYSKLRRLEFALPDPSFDYFQKPVERLSVSAAYGRYIGREAAGRTRARIDAALSYEDFSDDPLRHDRGLAAATLTYPVAEGFYISLGTVYATKPEFRGDVDAELSARAGLTYKLLSDQ